MSPDVRGAVAAQAMLPLTEATFLILTALAQPRHGYAVLQAVEAVSGGRVSLGPGTLYGAFSRLLKQGLVERLPDSDPEDDRRKLYRLTAFGVAVLAGELARLKELVGHGEAALVEVARREVAGPHG